MLQTYSKAIAAAAGGAVAGGVALPFLPENTPWYGHVAMAAVCILAPALAAYFAPKNRGE